MDLGWAITKAFEAKGGSVMKRMGTILLLVAMVCVAVWALAVAEPKPEESPNLRWEHYTLEFAAGTFAGFAGGALAYWLVYSSQAHVSGMAPMAEWFSIPIGSFIGASTGVIGAGWVMGDEGNVANALFTILGAAVGAYAGFIGANSAHILSFDSELAMVISTGLATAVPAALGAVIGYNLSFP